APPLRELCWTRHPAGMSLRGARDASPTARLPLDARPLVVRDRSCLIPADLAQFASVREGRLGDLRFLERGHDLPPEPLQLLETDRFGNADRQAARHAGQAAVAARAVRS